MTLPTNLIPQVGEYVHCRVFANDAGMGNPTIAIRLSHWPSAATLLSIAQQQPVDETTFWVMDHQTIEIRWFSHTKEVPLCGHGALAVSALLSSIVSPDAFLPVQNLPDRLWLCKEDGIPAIAIQPIQLTQLPTTDIDIGMPIKGVWDAGRDYLVMVHNEASLRAYQPNWNLLRQLNKIGCILCAPTTKGTAVFRFFAPLAGIPEDSASASVIPALIALFRDEQSRHFTFIQCAGSDVVIHGQQRDGKIMISGHTALSRQR